MAIADCSIRAFENSLITTFLFNYCENCKTYGENVLQYNACFTVTYLM
jgi:hypothetical protein